MRNIIITFFFILTFVGLSLEQAPNLNDAQHKALDKERENTTKIFESSENQRAPLPKIKRFYGELTKEHRKLITPSEADFAKYKEFLNFSKTGIVKILPYPKCDPNLVDANDLKCVQALPIIGNGSRYSFYKKSHIDFQSLNISFSDDKFSLLFRSNLLGIIVDLGESDINLFTLNTKEIRSLTSFLPTKKYSEVSNQMKQFRKGFTLEDKFYTTETPAKINNIYALRTVLYYKVKYFSWVNFYDDLTIVFQVVNKDSEGALTLIWKELKKDSRVEISE